MFYLVKSAPSVSGNVSVTGPETVKLITPSGIPLQQRICEQRYKISTHRLDHKHVKGDLGDFHIRVSPLFVCNVYQASLVLVPQIPSTSSWLL